MPEQLPDIQCNMVHIFKGRCILEFGHDLPHKYAYPEATGPELTESQKESFK